MNDKYCLVCNECRNVTDSYKDWISNGQKCLNCSSDFSYVNYKKFDTKCFGVKNAKSIWVYEKNLPIYNTDNITTLGEGTIEIENWTSLEKYASQFYNLKCNVFVLRNDNNPGTGTFKDLAGTLVSSILKEIKIDNYVVASTGNIGAALSRYLAMNDISFFAFIPKNSSKLQESEIRSNGGNVFRVNGDYSKAKEIAKNFADKHNYLLGGSGVDPLRIEAKKTMAYEFFRQKQTLPNIYIQSVSGGTGPIGFYKGSQELLDSKMISRIPKLFLYQSNKCSPMANSFLKAKQNSFKDEWYDDFEKIVNPQTKITTLATGNPTLYPYLSKIVHETNGLIDSVSENNIESIFKFIALNETVKIGPAACISILGFIKALQNREINNGDQVLINIGEGAKRTPSFFQAFQNDEYVENISDISDFSNILETRENSFRLLENVLLD